MENQPKDKLEFTVPEAIALLGLLTINGTLALRVLAFTKGREILDVAKNNYISFRKRYDT